jgi:hypothetical protein
MARTFQTLTAPVSLKAGSVLRITTTNGEIGVYRVTADTVVADFINLPAAGILQYISAESPTTPNPLLSGATIATVENDTTATLSGKFLWFVDYTTGTLNAIIAKVNSLTGRVNAVETLAASKAAIDDTTLASTTTTLSASKIVALNATVLSDANTFATNAANEAKAAAISQLAGVDGTQLQALNDLQAALQANSDADGVIASDLLNKVDYSKSQALTDAQAAQARANIKFDTAVAAAISAVMADTIGDVSAFNPDLILATALALD